MYLAELTKNEAVIYYGYNQNALRSLRGVRSKRRSAGECRKETKEMIG